VQLPSELNLDILSQQLETLKTEFCVPDIIPPEARIVFLLESPHIQELKFGAPVSGLSGGTMTKHLFGDDYAKYPLGRLVKQNADHAVHRPRLDAVGLMNVCNIPMQGSAYGNSRLRRQCSTLISLLEQIRSNNQRDEYPQVPLNLSQDLILADFRRRLVALQVRQLTLVPCGRFAQKFFRLAGLSNSDWTVIPDVPHPSYNSWDRLRYADAIHQVTTAFSAL